MRWHFYEKSRAIRDLLSKRLYVFERAGVPKRLRPLIGASSMKSR